MKLASREALEAWVSINVEQRVLDEGEVGEADPRLAQEDVRHIGEDIPLAPAIEDWQDA